MIGRSLRAFHEHSQRHLPAIFGHGRDPQRDATLLGQGIADLVADRGGKFGVGGRRSCRKGQEDQCEGGASVHHRAHANISFVMLAYQASA